MTMAKATRFELYQLDDVYGVQIWFDDGMSIRQEPFDSEWHAKAYAYGEFRELRTEFHYAFQITRLVIFFVDYYTLSNNSHPYFATSAQKYIRSKTGVSTCGQCQREVLTGKAKRFWMEWDSNHLQDLTGWDYVFLLNNIEHLKESYNYIVVSRQTFAGTSYSLPSWEVKKLSMMKLKSRNSQLQR